MRILILNWRCPRNPKAGGAELVTHEIARRLVSWGHDVEWFSSSFPGAAREETIDGISVRRAGRQWTVHLHAFRRYRGKVRGRFDVVIDQVNTVPFFTPIWADVPRFMFIHQLAREVWWYESPFPLNALGFVAEPWYLQIYRATPVLTVSRSTEDDLRRLGFSGRITIIPEGLEQIAVPPVTRASIPTFLYVGRLSPSKRVADVLSAFSLFRRNSVGRLWIVGNGSERYRRQLVRLAKRLGVANDVRFLGRVSNDDKYCLMATADALLVASVREGWGLVVTEANACGTPAIVYRVPGLQDAVKAEVTGLVVEPKPDAMAAGMTRLVRDNGLYNRLSTAAKTWSQDFSFDLSAEMVRTEIASALATD